MKNFNIDSVNMIRGLSFIGALMLFSLVQFIIPSRKMEKDRWQYMAANMGVVMLNNVLIRMLPLIPYQMAIICRKYSIGFFNMVNINTVMNTIIGVIILDITIYFQHRLFHQNSLLWKLHSMHHIDPLLDTTSALRFHPLEIMISNFIKVFIVILFGITPLGVVIFEVMLNVLAMFNHSNIKIESNIEHVINKVIFTPALHTIHHSKIRQETNSNYGFSVPYWDKIFGTFISQGKYSQEKISIGIPNMPNKKDILLPGMLIQPFKYKE